MSTKCNAVQDHRRTSTAAALGARPSRHSHSPPRKPRGASPAHTQHPSGAPGPTPQDPPVSLPLGRLGHTSEARSTSPLEPRQQRKCLGHRWVTQRVTRAARVASDTSDLQVNTWIPDARHTDASPVLGGCRGGAEKAPEAAGNRDLSLPGGTGPQPRSPAVTPRGLTCAEGSSASPGDRRLSPPRAAAPAGGASAPASLESPITSGRRGRGEAGPETPRHGPGPTYAAALQRRRQKRPKDAPETPLAPHFRPLTGRNNCGTPKSRELCARGPAPLSPGAATFAAGPGLVRLRRQSLLGRPLLAVSDFYAPPLAHGWSLLANTLGPGARGTSVSPGFSLRGLGALLPVV